MADIDLNLVTNVENSLKEIENFSKKSAKSLEAVENSFGNLEGSAKQFAANSTKSASVFESALGGLKVAAGALVAVFAGKAILNFFGNAVDAAKEQEEAIQTLNAALAINGDFTEEASKNFVKFADALEDSTGFSDDQALKLIALAKAFGATNEEAEKIVKTSVDYAAINKKSVEGTVESLAKTLNGLQGAVGKATPEIRALSKEQLRNGDAIEFLSKKYNGSAALLNQNFAGAIGRVSNSFEDLLKPIGTIISKNPVIIAGFNKLADLLRDLAEFLDDNKKAIIDLSVKGFEFLGRIISEDIRIIGKLTDIFDDLKVLVTGTQLVFVDLAETTIEVCNSIVSAFARVASLAFTPVINSVQLLANALNKLGIVSDDSANFIEGIGDSIRSTVVDGVSVFGGLLSSVGELKSTAEKSFEAATLGAGKSRAAFDKAADSTDKFLDGLVASGKQATNSVDVFNRLNASAEKGAGDFEEQAKALESLGKALESLKKDLDKADAQRNPIQGYKKEQQDRLEILDDSLRKALVSEQEAADLRQRINIDASTAIAKETEKIQKEQLENEKKRQADHLASIKKATSEGLASPLLPQSQANQIFAGGSDQGLVSPQAAGSISQIVGVIGASLEGAAGAAKLISATFGAIAESIVPGIGGAVAGIINVLAQGPEKVKELVQQFADALPEVLSSIDLAAVALVETLAKNAGKIVIGIVENLPLVIRALIDAAPVIAKALALELPKEMAAALRESLSRELTGSAISEAFKEFAIDVGRSGRQFTETTQRGAVAIRTDITNAGKNFGIQITNSLKLNVQQLTTSFQALIDNLGGFFASIPDKLDAGLSAVIDNLAGFFEGIPGKIEAGLLNVFDRLTIKLPEFKFPAFPAFNFPAFPALPKFEFPALPSFKFPDLPELKVAVPKFPELKLNLPTLKIEIPEFTINLPDLGKKVSAGGNVITSAFQKVGNALKPTGLATGGAVPPGFPNDSFPSFLSSGENVIDRDLNNRLESFLSRQDRSGGTAQPVKVVLQVGEKQLADVLLNINRQGFRTA